MIGLVVRFDLREDSVEAFDDLVAGTLLLIEEREPGTVQYAVHTVVDEPLVRVFYELYADEDAFAAHEAQPHVEHMLGRFEDLLTTAPRVERFSSVRGKGLPGAATT